MQRIALFLGAVILVLVPVARAQATLASFKGTYTFQSVQLQHYSVEYNMKGQQVGFCNATAVGYACSGNPTFDLLAGSLVADGVGHITSGTYAISRDPNGYECDPNADPTKPCPVVVPSGNEFSATEAYAVGATVDFTVGTVTRTFQAVRASTGKAPNWSTTATLANICSSSNLNTCYWTQIPTSLTNGSAGNSGTITGTYTIEANGSGVMTLTPTNCGGCGVLEFAFVVSPTSAVGQTFSIAGISKLGADNRMVGSGVRVK